MAKQFLILIFFLQSFICYSQHTSFQQELPFLKHLDSLNATEEKSAYLEYLNQKIFNGQNDTLKLEIAHSYFLSNDFQKALQSFLSVKSFNNQIEYKKELGFCLLKSKSYKQYIEISGNWEGSTDSTLIIQKLSASAMAFPENTNARMALRETIPIKTPEKNLQKKSPMLAGFYSAIIPGSGKLYCGKKHQFITTLLANTALGIQTVEAGVKDGTGSARFIVSGILFSFFYIGNIWGSVLSAKNYNIEQYRQFEYEILDYNGMLVNQ